MLTRCHFTSPSARGAQGKFEAAAEFYTKALFFDPQHFQALFNRGFCHDKLGRHAAALADYSAAIAVDPKNSYARYNRGITRDRCKDYEGAIVDFSAAVALDPSISDFYHNRGFSLRKQVSACGLQNFGRGPNQVVGLLTAASPCRHKPHVGSPRACSTHRACPGATQVKQHPCTDVVQTSQTSVQEKFEEAVADYSRAIALNPRHCRVYYNRAFCLDRLERYHDAIADYNAAVALDPAHASAYHNRGSLHERLGDAQLAMRDFDTALQLDPRASMTFNARALLLEAARKHDAALADYGRAIELDAGQTVFYKNRGVCLRACGRFEDAAADLERCAQVDKRGCQCGVCTALELLVVRSGMCRCADDDCALLLHDEQCAGC